MTPRVLTSLAGGSHPRLHFSTSTGRLNPRQNHYDTLGLPKAATKQQIKANFYKLSKRWHPDTASHSDSSVAKEKFVAVSEAYAILGDEVKRRSYDRTLDAPTTTSHRDGQSWGFGQDVEPDLTRRPRATYAWDQARRRRPPPPPPHYTRGSNAHPYRTHSHQHDDTHPNPRKTRSRLNDDPDKERDERLRNDNSVWRVVQVLGVVWVVMTLGGWTVNAG